MEMEELKQKARESWSGETGEDRAIELEKFLIETLNNYSKVLGISKEELLKKFEEKRTYSAINYYQVANFPKLENIEVFETIKQLRKKFPSGKFICPNCKGISTDSNKCNSGIKLKLINGNNKKEICNWCSGGLFGNLSGGYNFIVKEDFLNNPIIHKIFKPIELEVEDKNAK